MKIKYTFVALISFLMLISIFQIFPVPPFAGDIFPVYRSGYFRELDRNNKIVTDSFISIKTMAKPVFAWIFLSDLEKKYGIRIKVYDKSGFQVKAPGKKSVLSDPLIRQIYNSIRPEACSRINGNKYISVFPVFSENKCRFCHNSGNRGVIGAMSFERDFNSRVFYSRERILIFFVLSIVLGILLFLVLRWDPGKKVKELFDK